MENFSIKVSSEDLKMLHRISKSVNRRFDDIVQLIFAEGLGCMFCEECIHVDKEPQDYTPDEKKQLELNAEIDKVGYKTFKEKEAAGFKYVIHCLSNSNYNSETNTHTDELIEPMVARIRQIALD